VKKSRKPMPVKAKSAAAPQVSAPQLAAAPMPPLMYVDTLGAFPVSGSLLISGSVMIGAPS
jgi:hypothetical protein